MENKEIILKAINEYLMNMFKYKASPADFGLNKSTIHGRRKRVTLYLRMIEIDGGLWDVGTFVLAQISFQQERKGHGTDFLQFLTDNLPTEFTHIGIEYVNDESRSFTLKHGFKPHKSVDEHYITAISDLKKYFQG
jgi:hypothetical protein